MAATRNVLTKPYLRAWHTRCATATAPPAPPPPPKVSTSSSAILLLSRCDAPLGVDMGTWACGLGWVHGHVDWDGYMGIVDWVHVDWDGAVHRWKGQLVLKQRALLPCVLHYYTATLQHCYTTTLLHGYTATRLLCYTATLLLYYTATLLHCYTTTLLHGYTATLLHYSSTPLLLYYTATRRTAMRTHTRAAARASAAA